MIRVPAWRRAHRQYGEWGLHVFGGAAQETAWAEPLPPTGQDEFGCYWDVPVTQGMDLECIVHRGDEKDVEARVPLDWSDGAWMVTGRGVFGHAPDLGSFPMGNLQRACAAWVDETTLLWHGAAEGGGGVAHRFSLVAGRELEVVTGGDGVAGQDTEWIPLEVVRTQSSRLRTLTLTLASSHCLTRRRCRYRCGFRVSHHSDAKQSWIWIPQL